MSNSRDGRSGHETANNRISGNRNTMNRREGTNPVYGRNADSRVSRGGGSVSGSSRAGDAQAGGSRNGRAASGSSRAGDAQAGRSRGQRAASTSSRAGDAQAGRSRGQRAASASSRAGNAQAEGSRGQRAVSASSRAGNAQARESRSQRAVSRASRSRNEETGTIQRKSKQNKKKSFGIHLKKKSKPQKKASSKTKQIKSRNPELRKSASSVRRNQPQPAKVIPYKKPLNINLGMIIFGIIFVYVAICVFMYFTSKHVIGYEVVSGSLSVPNVYKGIAIRKEHLVDTSQAGYVNYFAREGEHVGKGDLVYTIDQSGKIAELINTENDAVQLSDSDLNKLKTEIVIFQHNYDHTSFEDVYDFRFSIKGTALKLSNNNMLSSVDSISDAGMVNFCTAPESGVVVYSVDGYENLTPETLSENSLDSKEYEKRQLTSNELVSQGDTAYKLITDENWSIVIEVSEERAAWLEKEEYVEVRFLKNEYTSWAKAEVLRKGEELYAVLTFNNSMITFATDRFIDIELVSNEEQGLKIPNSSIVEKEFYLIPKQYAQVGSKGELNGFLRETYDEQGNISSELIETTIYSESDTDYYVDTSELRIGDYIIMQDSQNKYPVSKVGTLIGVYNMDKGYADFKEITILYANEEYSIVKSNTQYGLSVYDHIVLDASSVEENDFIHER